MKLHILLWLLMALFCYSASAQSLKDSIKKYRAIERYYLRTEDTEKWWLYRSKADSLQNVVGAIQVVDRKRKVERKYGVRL